MQAQVGHSFGDDLELSDGTGDAGDLSELSIADTSVREFDAAQMRIVLHELVEGLRGPILLGGGSQVDNDRFRARTAEGGCLRDAKPRRRCSKNVHAIEEDGLQEGQVGGQNIQSVRGDANAAAEVDVTQRFEVCRVASFGSARSARLAFCGR